MFLLKVNGYDLKWLKTSLLTESTTHFQTQRKYLSSSYSSSYYYYCYYIFIYKSNIDNDDADVNDDNADDAQKIVLVVFLCSLDFLATICFYIHIYFAWPKPSKYIWLFSVVKSPTDRIWAWGQSSKSYISGYHSEYTDYTSVAFSHLSSRVIRARKKIKAAGDGRRGCLSEQYVGTCFPRTSDDLSRTSQ